MVSETSIRKKLKSKERTLQFLPIKMKYLVEQKNILHNNKKIKTAYLVDIIHNLILKYYFKKDNKFTLNSSILKEKYGPNRPNVDFNILRWPSFMSPLVLPDDIKIMLHTKLKKWYEENKSRKRRSHSDWSKNNKDKVNKKQNERFKIR